MTGCKHNNANTAVGYYALQQNTTGIRKMPLVLTALTCNTGNYNAAYGAFQMQLIQSW